jgi:hypothetical protein
VRGVYVHGKKSQQSVISSEARNLNNNILKNKRFLLAVEMTDSPNATFYEFVIYETCLVITIVMRKNPF